MKTFLKRLILSYLTTIILILVLYFTMNELIIIYINHIIISLLILDTFKSWLRIYERELIDKRRWIK